MLLNAKPHLAPTVKPIGHRVIGVERGLMGAAELRKILKHRLARGITKRRVICRLAREQKPLSFLDEFFKH